MRKLIFILMISATLLSFVSCKKNGLGGKATIVALPKHNGEPIYGSTAYVFFKTSVQPASPTDHPNLNIVGEANEDHVHIENLLPGKYYVYITGFDSITGTAVAGGAAQEIKYKDRSSEIDLEIPVQ